jgi:hypothetical protein
MEIVEIKFKEKNQRDNWENLPVIRYIYKDELEQAIEWIKRLFQCTEIRWNYSRSSQGHYIDGSVSRYE